MAGRVTGGVKYFIVRGFAAHSSSHTVVMQAAETGQRGKAGGALQRHFRCGLHNKSVVVARTFCYYSGFKF